MAVKVKTGACDGAGRQVGLARTRPKQVVALGSLCIGLHWLRHRDGGLSGAADALGGNVLYRRLLSLSALLIGAYCLLLTVIGSTNSDEFALMPASFLLSSYPEEAWP